ncbi:hypothetical protein PANDA_018278 [Ailuropoda melanoleuca]|uniref:Uncharacterized protein n=1 Tax=Ailuropoda melanoleuca TaxID=9646 RepID=D2HZM6_AILME|nr:hypothetical protein PANDA_018278 [Ailuropoda melanoleuca]
MRQRKPYKEVRIKLDRSRVISTEEFGLDSPGDGKQLKIGKQTAHSYMFSMENSRVLYTCISAGQFLKKNVEKKALRSKEEPLDLT